MLAVPVVNCATAGPGTSRLPVIGLACMFMLQDVDPTTGQVFAEVVNSCEVNGNPGPVPNTGPGPYTIQLYHIPGSTSHELVQTVANQITATPRARPQRGLAMVEFVIGAPILLFLFYCAVEIGEILLQESVLADAARNARSISRPQRLAGQHRCRESYRAR